jgi:hypothetical protein
MKLAQIIALVAIIAMLTSARAQQAPVSENLVNQVDPSLSCGSGLLGGYSPTTLDPTQQIEYTYLALNSFLSTPSGIQLLTNCPSPNLDALSPPVVLASCSQVVAGTNYAIIFEATIPCSNDASAGGETVSATLFTQIYVPLPYTNSPPTVTSVRQL